MKKMYRVYVIDTRFEWPLTYHEIYAWTKWGAKRKVFIYVCGKDKSYRLVASRCKV